MPMRTLAVGEARHEPGSSDADALGDADATAEGFV
jgi:hypothetical protein